MTDANSAGAGQRLTRCLPDWEPNPSGKCRIGVLQGEGVGPEIIRATLAVLDSVVTPGALDVEIRHFDGQLEEGQRLSGACEEFCEAIFACGGALLCGPLGRRLVYDLRRRFDLFCKLVPLRPAPALADVGVIRPELLQGVDVVIVRENVGGLYFGEFGRREGGKVAFQSLQYRAADVRRLLDVAARLARQRSGRFATIVKSGGIPAVSALWREEAEAAARDADVIVEMIEADNASFQLVADARRFDVVAAPNLIGDILADGATVLLASRGMSYSGNFGSARRAAYQTGHGAAHDLAGSGRANPMGQIASLAMMLRESFGAEREARAIEAAVDKVLAQGIRTADIARAGSRSATTEEIAEAIARAASSLYAEAEVA